MMTCDLIEHEFIRDEVCVVTIKCPGAVQDQAGLVEALCKLLSDLYAGSTKLIIFQGNLTPVDAEDGIKEALTIGEFLIAHTKAEMLSDILLAAPYFSLSRMTGNIEDLFADIAIACDWRLLSPTSHFCFASRRNLHEVQTAPRLAELVSSFRAFDAILRRHIISSKEALKIGLVLPEAPEEDVVADLEKHAVGAKKESIAIMRRAIRGPSPKDISVARIVSSVSVEG